MIVYCVMIETRPDFNQQTKLHRIYESQFFARKEQGRLSDLREKYENKMNEAPQEFFDMGLGNDELRIYIQEMATISGAEAVIKNI